MFCYYFVGKFIRNLSQEYEYAASFVFIKFDVHYSFVHFDSFSRSKQNLYCCYFAYYKSESYCDSISSLFG